MRRSVELLTCFTLSVGHASGCTDTASATTPPESEERKSKIERERARLRQALSRSTLQFEPLTDQRFASELAYILENGPQGFHDARGAYNLWLGSTGEATLIFKADCKTPQVSLGHATWTGDAWQLSFEVGTFRPPAQIVWLDGDLRLVLGPDQATVPLRPGIVCGSTSWTSSKPRACGWWDKVGRVLKHCEFSVRNECFNLRIRGVDCPKWRDFGLTSCATEQERLLSLIYSAPHDRTTRRSRE